MNVTICIDHAAITRQLLRVTGYIGSKTIITDDCDYRRIALTEGDGEMLQDLWQRAHERLNCAIGEHIIAEGIEGDSYRIDIALVHDNDAGLLPALQAAATSYYVNSLIASWLQISGHSQSPHDEAARSALATLAQINHPQYYVRRP